MLSSLLPSEIWEDIFAYLFPTSKFVLVMGEDGWNTRRHQGFVSRNDLIWYYLCWRGNSMGKEDHDLYSALERSKEPMYPIRLSKTWHRIVEKYHTEYYQTFTGSICINGEMVQHDSLCHWYATVCLRLSTRWEYINGGRKG